MTVSKNTRFSVFQPNSITFRLANLSASLEIILGTASYDNTNVHQRGEVSQHFTGPGVNPEIADISRGSKVRHSVAHSSSAIGHSEVMSRNTEGSPLTK